MISPYKKTMTLTLATVSRGMIYLMGLSVLIICAILIPEIAREEMIANTSSAPLIYPFLVGVWLLSIPIFVALHQALKLITTIDKNTAFSSTSVKTLKNIEYCALSFSCLVGIGATFTMLQGKSMGEDVTPVATISIVFISASIVIAIFTAVLKRLLQNAIDIKSENDLIV